MIFCGSSILAQAFHLRVVLHSFSSTANMASQCPPGLQRPSSWPIRNQRRHSAIAEFNAGLMSSLQDLHVKVENNAINMRILQTSITDLSEKVDGFTAKSATALSSNANELHFKELAQRVSGMELLLFGSSLEDFQNVIDKRINQATCISSQSATDTCVNNEPEAERSPCKAAGPYHEEPNGANNAPIPCPHFDISDEKCSADEELSIVDPLARCEELLLKFKSSLVSLPLQERSTKYQDLITKEFDAVFALFPRRPDVRTAITDNEFKKKYNMMHKSPLWFAVTRKYHAGTGDPMSKSDSFLNVMDMIVRFGDALNNA